MRRTSRSLRIALSCYRNGAYKYSRTTRIYNTNRFVLVARLAAVFPYESTIPRKHWKVGGTVRLAVGEFDGGRFIKGRGWHQMIETVTFEDAWAAIDKMLDAWEVEDA